MVTFKVVVFQTITYNCKVVLMFHMTANPTISRADVLQSIGTLVQIERSHIVSTMHSLCHWASVNWLSN